MSTQENRLHIEELEKKFKNYKMISIKDFHEFYEDVFGDVKKNTVNWIVYELKKRKIITNISRGVYILSSEQSSETNEYVVITMDIINSSKLEYSKFDNMLAQKIRVLNSILNERYNIERKFHISQGDEIQILLSAEENIGDIVLLTCSFLYPLQVRYGISIGIIQEELKFNSWDMNGPLFWNARDQLEKIKNKKNYEGLIRSNYKETDRLCNNILPLINRSINKITEKQWEAIRLDLSKVNLEDAIIELDISRTSYYDRLEVSNISEIKMGFKVVQDLLNKRRDLN